MVQVRKGQAQEKVDRETFRERYRERFVDPAFDGERDAIDRLETIAWHAYAEGRKAPRTRRAGDELADPSYELSLDWLAARSRIRKAAEAHADKSGPTRVLVINASSRNDGTCPGEISKSFRLCEIISAELERAEITLKTLDLSRLTSEPLLHIHPCKGCVSTAMPLCHWPCSCYPNHASGQTNDMMNDIYPLWVEAHGIVIVTPVYWYQSPTPLKAMIDRLVCADGGNPDPTTTQGKKPELAKQIELDGWDYPKHLAGRAFGVLVHGDVAGVEAGRRMLGDWLGWMGLVSAGGKSQLDRYIG
ncbi:MAG: flavodoxin family protein, partial [Myxococcales bacterium]|nr:flavodoxin family protein [Myxococcales bacterium]